MRTLAGCSALVEGDRFKVIFLLKLLTICYIPYRVFIGGGADCEPGPLITLQEGIT